MKLLTCFFAFLILGNSLLADGNSQEKSGVTQLLEGKGGQTMASVIAMTGAVKYSALMNQHAFWLLESQDPSLGSTSQQSLVSFIAFKDQLIYSHAGNGELFKKCTVFRFRDSLQLISGSSLWGSDDDYEGGLVETQPGDVYVACNLDLLFFVDQPSIETILKQNSASIADAAMALLDAAKGQGADRLINVAVIQIPPDASQR